MMARHLAGFALFSLLSWPLLSAQQAGGRPDPTIFLLTSQVPKLDPEVLGAAAGRAYPNKPTVAVDGDRATLSFGNSSIVVRCVRQAIGLDAGATADVDDRDSVARIQQHRGAWLLSVPGVSQEMRERIEAHQVLGLLAAELIGPDTIGVGCLDFQRVEPVHEGTAHELREQTMEALGPTKWSRVEVLLAAPRKWTAAELRAAVTKQFGVQIPEDASGEAAKSVSVQEEHVRIVVQGVPMILQMNEQPHPGLDTVILDERAKAAAEQHHAWLLVAAYGKSGAANVLARERAIARMLAGLWGDDCLAYFWKTDRRLIVTDSWTSTLLGSEEPVATTLAAGFAVREVDEAALQEAAQKARTSWSEAAAFVAAGSKVFARLRTRHEDASERQMLWAMVAQVGGEGAESASVAELQKVGDALTNDRTEMIDWVCLHEGKLRGGFLLQLQMAAMRKPAPKAGK